MKVTSAEFRKNFVQIIERALGGELVDVVHKDRALRLVPVDTPAKMPHLIPRDTIVGTPEKLDQAQQELDSEMRTLWEERWARNSG